VETYIKIIKPNIREVEKYLVKWKTLENYVLQEKSLKKLFTKTYPSNNKIEDVLIKVCALNDFYSTNILSPFIVSKHILNLTIDKRLQQRDYTLVNEIAHINVKRNKIINFYSFASKYCSHHQPNYYPIYDNFVEKFLMYLRNEDKFYDFKRAELKDYPKYRQILLEFRKYYKLNKYSLKQLDKYLWQAGKKYFPRKYY
jgi:hypothetical protein